MLDNMFQGVKYTIYSLLMLLFFDILSSSEIKSLKEFSSICCICIIKACGLTRLVISCCIYLKKRWRSPPPS